jgi:hypothetical protein
VHDDKDVSVRYRLKEPTSVDLDDGRVVCSFPAGDRAPKDEAETEALEHLVAIGIATRVKTKED